MQVCVGMEQLATLETQSRSSSDDRTVVEMCCD
jgi:hypothetical protein